MAKVSHAPKRSIVLIEGYMALGGPAKTFKDESGIAGGPTDAGIYKIAYCKQHSSATRYQAWSKIAWGTPLQDNLVSVSVMHQGKWKKLEEFTPVTREDILDRHEALYHTRKVPKTWVFNDFGHLTCYFFKDLNQNGRLDKNKGEKIHGEFIHSTPDNEAQTALGEPVVMTNSHGCIHVQPKDVDDMKAKGYLDRGTTVVVHKYTTDIPATLTKGVGSKPFAIHFYPKRNVILVEGWH